MRWLMCGVLSLVAGCSTGSGDPRPVAEDVVCRYEGDLGCVRVRVDEHTPRAEYRGVTYYFCRDTCRAKFLKEPEKYLAR